MRIFIVISSLSLFIFFAGFRTAEAQIKPGLRAGLNFSDFKEPIFQENNGVHVGPYLRISLAGIIAVEPGAQFSNRKLAFISNTASSKVTLNYLDFPLVLRLSVLPFVNVFGGPQVSLLLGEKYEGTGTFDSRGHLPKQELGAVTGIAVQLPLGLNLQGSYDFGLSDLEYDGHRSKNRIFKISLGKDF